MMSTTGRPSADASTQGILGHYLALIDEAFDHRAWHGTTLRGSLRGVTAVQAAARPAPERHNIWEVALHAAYWKYAVARQLDAGRRGGFPVKGSNWFRRPLKLSEPAWRADVALLVEQHRRLRDLVERLDVADFARRPAGSRYTRAFLIRGIAAHDLYHTGQIQLIKKGQGPKATGKKAKGEGPRANG